MRGYVVGAVLLMTMLMSGAGRHGIEMAVQAHEVAEAPELRRELAQWKRIAVQRLEELNEARLLNREAGVYSELISAQKTIDGGFHDSSIDLHLKQVFSNLARVQRKDPMTEPIKLVDSYIPYGLFDWMRKHGYQYQVGAWTWRLPKRLKLHRPPLEYRSQYDWELLAQQPWLDGVRVTRPISLDEMIVPVVRGTVPTEAMGQLRQLRFTSIHGRGMGVRQQPAAELERRRNLSYQQLALLLRSFRGATDPRVRLELRHWIEVEADDIGYYSSLEW